MSSPKSISWLLIIIACSAMLTGCGFQPLHSAKSGASAANLAEIHIAPIADRIGQQFRNLLLDKLTPKGQSLAPRYELYVTLAEARQSLAVRKDTVATRANLIMRASFKLVRIEDEVVLMTNSAISANSYNILNEEFATLSAENDARVRAVRELSDTIRTRVAVYLDNKN